MIVTIDGPAGSGKSTAARRLAERLDVPYLDTGAMYRALAWAALDRNVDLADEAALVELARQVDLKLDCGSAGTRVRVDGRDVSDAVRSLAVSAATSRVAGCEAVRSILVARQRDTGKALGSFVTEGRDQGSIVFPQADAKFVLDASLERRAERRANEMRSNRDDVDIQSVIEDLRRRDAVDARQWEPLLAPEQAIVIDTTDLSIDQLIDRMAEALRNQGV